MTNHLYQTAREAADTLVSRYHGTRDFDGIAARQDEYLNLSFAMAVYFMQHVESWYHEQTTERWKLMYEAFWQELENPLTLLNTQTTEKGNE